jgi:hypothetical protein
MTIVSVASFRFNETKNAKSARISKDRIANCVFLVSTKTSFKSWTLQAMNGDDTLGLIKGNCATNVTSSKEDTGLVSRRVHGTNKLISPLRTVLSSRGLLQ